MVRCQRSLDTVLLSFRGEAKVTEEISPIGTGCVRFQGSFWRARFRHDYRAHRAGVESTVEVVGRQGLTLLVAPHDIRQG